MDIKGSIYIQSKVMSMRCPEVEELEQICQENGIQFDERFIRMDALGPQASLLQPLIAFVFSPEIIAGIASGVIATGICALLKSAMAKAVNAIRNKTPANAKIGRPSIVEVKSPNTFLRIEADQVSDEVLVKALDAFVDLSKGNYDMERIIPVYVVVDKNGEVIIMKQNDYIWKYVATKNATEDTTDGQAENDDR